MDALLSRRAHLAVVLFAGFWLLAFATIAFLVAGPFWLWHNVTFFRVFAVAFMPLALFSWIVGLIVAASVLPRYERFKAPGPELKPGDHPRLFELLKDTASATGQPLPDKVYLIPEANAAVAQVGGWLGLGSRRVMMLGLPMLYGLTQPQLRAVLAHEFGHYRGGDDRLAAWVHRNFSVVARVVNGLNSLGALDHLDDSYSGRLRMLAHLVNLPFLSYGNFVLRVFRSVARAQEYRADRVAGEVVNPETMRATLRAVAGLGKVYEDYWKTHVRPVIDLGYRLPVGEGFQQYLRSPLVKKQLEGEAGRAMEEREPNPYDTHPTLRERLEALERTLDAAKNPLVREGWVAELLGDRGRIEADLLGTVLPEAGNAGLQGVTWAEVGTVCFVPYWGEVTRAESAVLKGVSVGQLPVIARDLLGFAHGMRGADGDAGAGEMRRAAVHLLACALGKALHEQGFEVRVSPDRPVQLRKGGAVLEPVTLIWQMDSRELTHQEWLALMRQAGIADKALGA